MVNPDRPQVDERDLTPEPLRPAAAPTDTYFKTAAGQQLAQLADALSGVGRELRPYSDLLARRANARSEVAGQAQARKVQAMQDDAADYRDAMNKGLIPPNANPWFVQGAKEQFGRVAADQYAAALSINNATALQYSTDPKDFEKEQQKFRTEWTQKHGLDQADPTTQQAFNLKADLHTEEARRTYTAEAGDRLMHQADQATYQEVAGAFDTEWNRVGQDGKPMDPATRDANIVHSLQVIADRAYATGLPGRRVNMAVSAGIADYAKRMKDETILDFMGKVTAGSGPIKNTQIGSQAFIAARDEIAEAHIRDNRIISEQNSDRRAARLDAENDVSGRLLDAMFKAKAQGVDLSEFDLQPWREEMIKADPSKYDLVDKIAHQLISQDHRDDPSLVGSLEVRINTLKRDDPNAVGQTQLVDAWTSGHLSPATYEKLSKQIETREKSGGEGKLLRDPIYTREVGSMRTLYHLQNGETPDPITGYRLKAATEEFTQSWLTYIDGAGSTASDKERQEQATYLSNQAFLHHATAQQLKDLTKVPAAEKATGPQPVDPATALVTDKSNVSKLLREVNASDSTHAFAFSQGSLHVIRDIAHIKLTGDPKKDLQAIREFASKQKAILDRK